MILHELPHELRRECGVNMPLNKVIHIGANIGQEVDLYESKGIEGYHVEAHPNFFSTLKGRCDATTKQKAIEACCYSSAGKNITFNVTNNNVSSSILPLGRHAVAYPQVKITERIDLESTTIDILVDSNLLPKDADFLLIDVQGAESEVLIGAAKLLQSITLWGVLVEVSLDPLYEGGASFEEVYSRFLKPRGYFLKSVNFNKHGWTDALFLKRWWNIPGEDITPLAAISRPWKTDGERGSNIAPRGRCTQSSLSEWSSHDGEAANAVRGAPTGGYAFHTALESNSWWMIEWDEPQQLNEILCFNRVNNREASARINGVIFEYSLDGNVWNTVYEATKEFGGIGGKELRIPLDSILAKKFRVRQPRKDYLHFDHIKFLQKFSQT